VSHGCPCSAAHAAISANDAAAVSGAPPCAGSLHDLATLADCPADEGESLRFTPVATGWPVCGGERSVLAPPAPAHLVSVSVSVSVVNTAVTANPCSRACTRDMQALTWMVGAGLSPDRRCSRLRLRVSTQRLGEPLAQPFEVVGRRGLAEHLLEPIAQLHTAHLCQCRRLQPSSADRAACLFSHRRAVFAHATPCGVRRGRAKCLSTACTCTPSCPFQSV
jgi:hypothetical protein